MGGIPAPIGFGNETWNWPSAGRSTARAIRWERCSSISSPPSPSSKPISSACAPARVWQSPAPGVNCAANSPNCPTDSSGNLPHACQGRVFHQRSRRVLLRLKTNRLSYTQAASFPLTYDPAPYRNRPDVARLGLTWPPTVKTTRWSATVKRDTHSSPIPGRAITRKRRIWLGAVVWSGCPAV